MARGAQKSAEDMSKNAFNSSQQFNTQQEASNKALEGGLLSGFGDMIKNPGYDAATKSAITNTTEGAIGSSFAGSADQLARTAARTGNGASMTAGLDRLAQEKGQTMADSAAKNQIAFADAKRQDVRTGLAGESQIYGMDQNLLARSLGIPVEYLNSYINAGQMKKGGFTQAFGTSLGSSLGSGIGSAATAPL